MLKDAVPTAAELKPRRHFYDLLMEIHAHKPPGKGPFPSTEDMIRRTVIGQDIRDANPKSPAASALYCSLGDGVRR